MKQLKKVRENRAGTGSFVKRRQDAIDTLIAYLMDRGMDRNEAELEALDTYNYLLDNPAARTDSGAAALANFPDVLNIGGGALIREYEKQDIREPKVTRDKSIKGLNENYVKADPEDFERSTFGAIINPVEEAMKRGTIKAAEDLGTSPAKLQEELTNTTADFLRTDFDKLAFDTIDDKGEIGRDGSLTYARTTYSPKTTVDSMNAAKVELYPSLARNFNLDSKVSITGSTISIEPLSTNEIGTTGPLGNIIETDFGTVLALTDELIGARFARNGAVDVAFINHLRERSQDLAPAINQIRSVFADIGPGGKGKRIREAANLYLANLEAKNPNAAETARANLDSMLRKEFAMFGGEIPELIKTSPQMAQMIIDGQVPTNVIKNVALHIFNQDSQTTELNVQTSREPRKAVSDEELLSIIQDTGGDISDALRFEEVDTTIDTSFIDGLKQDVNKTVENQEIKQKESPIVTTARDIAEGIETVKGFRGTDASRIARAKRDFAGIRNKIAVAIERGDMDKVRQFVEQANEIKQSVADIDSEEINNLFAAIESSLPTEIAQNMWHGGIMMSNARHRFNTGGTIDNITVKGTRENPFAFDAGLLSPSFAFGRGSGSSGPQTPDGTFDPDLRGSAMMEDDEGYDEAYNYTQKMRDSIKKEVTDKINSFEDFINDPLKTAKEKGIELENSIRKNLEKVDFLDIVDKDTLNYKDTVKEKGILKTLTTDDPLDAFVGDIFKGLFGSKTKKEKKTSE